MGIFQYRSRLGVGVPELSPSPAARAMSKLRLRKRRLDKVQQDVHEAHVVGWRSDTVRGVEGMFSEHVREDGNNQMTNLPTLPNTNTITSWPILPTVEHEIADIATQARTLIDRFESLLLRMRGGYFAPAPLYNPWVPPYPMTPFPVSPNQTPFTPVICQGNTAGSPVAINAESQADGHA